ncbi:Uncharacterised protein [uncultured archaeon]|nr:Uncharacterised protein [uncultured archaeon]
MLIWLGKEIIPYEVLIDERVEKDLEKVPNHVVNKFLKLLDEFEKNPIRPRPGFDVKPMEGYPGNTYRLRIRAYPKSPAALKVIHAHAKCSIAI